MQHPFAMAGLLAAFVCTPVSVCASQPELDGPVTVTVDFARHGNIMAPRAMGIHTSIYDGDMTSEAGLPLLRNAGITTLRYPGGGYSDNYHWSTHKMTYWKTNPQNVGYVAPHTGFGEFARYVEKLGGTSIITVNYGSNLQGKGPGEPKEAAAWVAYANALPNDTRVIGVDGAGNDWKTVGYWASMRASQPLATDDGYNFLRIGHPAPFNIKYWEIGNELFGNGYYAKDDTGGFEEDLHAPYAQNEHDNPKIRAKNPKLSPFAYGEGVVEFSKAMKAVDPRIWTGAVLNTPPADNSWGPDWNPEVMRACGSVVDFVIIHWYTGALLPPDWKKLDNANFLDTPHSELPQMIASLLELFKKYAPGRNVGFAVTEMGARPYSQVTDPYVHGLFAADAYASLIEDGVNNIDWLELHANQFLAPGNAPNDGVQGTAYYGIQMVHHLLNWNDAMVMSKSSNALVSAHAALRRDGSMGVMLINKDPKNTATVKLKLNDATGINLTGTRFVWGKSVAPEKAMVHQEPFTAPGSSFTVQVPPYSIVDLSFPKLSN